MTIGRRQFVRLASQGALAISALGMSCASRAPGSGVSSDRAEARGARLDILVLGGTGFLGPDIVRVAQGRGHRLTLFNRGKTNPELFPDVEKLHGDRDGGLEPLRGRRWDAVVDTSGYVPRVVKQSAELLAPSVRRYLFVSSISAYAAVKEPGTTEDAPLAQLPANDLGTEDVRQHYGALKAACERTVEAALPRRTLVVRPGLIVGPGDPTDRFTYWPARVARGGEVLAPGDGEDPVQLIDARDLAAFVVKLLEDDEAGTFNAAGPRGRMSMRELLAACKAGTGSDAHYTWVDEKFLEERGVQPWSDLPVWVPRRSEDGGLTQVSIERAVSRGLAFRPTEDTVRDTYGWWSSLPAARREKMRAGIPPEREAELLAAWKSLQR
ncbi:MAG TPA: NAD-dependent epimerase/dehydratase family protein [Anaeromyxobacteraceae bacterium]|nr:NAD-dependent epimerase/dehydratase family protein [Anaeromyxobacteraceae bacterium]